MIIEYDSTYDEAECWIWMNTQIMIISLKMDYLFLKVNKESRE